jgi:hypothetical protein
MSIGSRTSPMPCSLPFCRSDLRSPKVAETVWVQERQAATERAQQARPVSRLAVEQMRAVASGATLSTAVEQANTMEMHRAMSRPGMLGPVVRQETTLQQLTARPPLRPSRASQRRPYPMPYKILPRKPPVLR